MKTNFAYWVAARRQTIRGVVRCIGIDIRLPEIDVCVCTVGEGEAVPSTVGDD